MAQANGQQPNMLQRASTALGLDGFFKSPQEVDQTIQRQSPSGRQGYQFNPAMPQGDGNGSGNPNNPQQPNSHPNQPGQQQQQTGGTGSGANNNPESFQNPLDVYKGLFDNTPPTDKDGKPKVNEPPAFKLDPTIIGKAAESMDFMSGLPQDITDKLQSGQVDANVLQAVVNHAGRNAYARAMEHASTLTDKFVGMRLGHEKQGLNSEVQRILANNKVLSNPNIANNPALKEHMEMVSNQLARKYPDQTPEWIADKTQQYFQDLATAVNPDLGRPQQPAESYNPRNGELRNKDGKVFDWGGYLKE